MSRYQFLVFANQLSKAISQWEEEAVGERKSPEVREFFIQILRLLPADGGKADVLIRHAEALMLLFLHAILGEHLLKEEEFIVLVPSSGIPTAKLVESPLDPEPYHFDRPELVNQMEALLSEHRLLVLYGLDGIGKSMLAREFARKNAERFRFVFYAEFRQSFSETVRSLPVQFPLPAGNKDRDIPLMARMQAIRKLGPDDLLIIAHVENDQDSFPSLLRDPVFREWESLPAAADNKPSRCRRNESASHGSASAG